MSHFYGIHPWDVDRLTVAELEEYHADLVRTAKAAEKAAKSNGR